MNGGSRELHPLDGLIGELERSSASLKEAESVLAGSLAPGTSEILARLAAAGQHLDRARRALAGEAGGDGEPGRMPQVEDLQGSSRAVPIQDLLCFLATGKKSGVLRVEAEAERYLLQLQEGAVVYATGDSPPAGQALSDLLAAQGVRSAELLRRLPERDIPGTWHDPNLVGTSWISRDSLASAIQRQTRFSFFRLCSARHTRFRFYEGAQIQNVVPVRQNAMELLLEYSRVLDEHRRRARPAAAPRPAPEGISARGRPGR